MCGCVYCLWWVIGANQRVYVWVYFKEFLQNPVNGFLTVSIFDSFHFLNCLMIVV